MGCRCGGQARAPLLGFQHHMGPLNMSTVNHGHMGSITAAMVHETDVTAECSGLGLRCGAQVANQRALKRRRRKRRRCHGHDRGELLGERLGGAVC